MVLMTKVSSGWALIRRSRQCATYFVKGIVLYLTMSAIAVGLLLDMHNAAFAQRFGLPSYTIDLGVELSVEGIRGDYAHFYTFARMVNKKLWTLDASCRVRVSAVSYPRLAVYGRDLALENSQSRNCMLQLELAACTNLHEREDVDSAILAIRALHDYSGGRSEITKLVRVALAEIFREHKIIRSIALEELGGFVSAHSESYLQWLQKIRRGVHCSSHALKLTPFSANDADDTRIRETALAPLSHLKTLPRATIYPIALLRSMEADGVESEWGRAMRYELCSVESTVIPKHLRSAIRCSLETLIYSSGSWMLVYATAQEAAKLIAPKVIEFLSGTEIWDKSGQPLNWAYIID